MIDKFLISKVRVKILKLFLLNVNNTYHVREIVRQTGEEINAVRRILKELEDIRFLISERNGNRLYYVLNKEFEFFNELVSIFNKEFGLGKKIIKHKTKIGNIRVAFFTNSYLLGNRKSDEEIDLVIIGSSINYIYLDKLVKQYEEDNKKSINYTYLTQSEFDSYKKENSHFLYNVVYKDKIILIGDSSFIYL
jgi:hypothetical protein